MQTTRKLYSLLLSLIMITTLSACGGDDGQSGDGDLDDISGDEDFEPWWDSDSESGDGFRPCEPDKCEGGLFCNTDTGLCQNCVQDIDCGLPDPVNGITPTCFDGVCEDLVCQSMFAVPSVDKGAGLPLFPIQPEFDAEKHLIVDGKLVFPIGISHIPEWKFEEAKNAGFNLAINGNPCCATELELTEQETYLNSAQEADLYVGLLPFDPAEQIESGEQAKLRQSVTQRSNHPPLLFWLMDLPSFSSETVWIDSLADYVSDIDESHPLALAEYGNFDYSPYYEKIRPIIHTLEIPDDDDFSATISKLENLTTSIQAPPVWARIPVFGASTIECLKGNACNPTDDNPDAETIETLAMLAIGAGARGLIFWGYEVEPYAMADDPDKWKDLAKAVARIQARSLLWLAPAEKALVSADPVNPYVRVFSYAYEKVVITYAINATNDEQSVSLTVAPERAPFCYGDESEDTVLHLQHETSLEITLGAHEIKVLQFAEASNPGGEK